VVADRMVCKIPLELVGRVFSTSLVILEGQGINVILGINWMEIHKAVLDISARLVHIDSLSSARFFCICHLLLIFKHLFTLLLPRVWMRYLWPMSIWMYFLMIYQGCLLIGPLYLRSSCSLALPLSISDHIQWC
jgi:hypothetical protein